MLSEAKKVWKRYYDEFTKAMKDKSFRTGTTRATESYEHKMFKLLEKYPETLELAKEVRKIKEESINNIDELIRKTIESFRKHGANVYIAKDSDEAREIIGEIIGTGKIIVKGKSITSEEIGLREYLIEKGNEVWETDLGEFIIQLMHDRPMHIVTPSLHVPREKVAGVFEKTFKGKFDPQDVQSLVRAASDFLREKYYKAHFGIIGANVIAAEEGAAVIIHNEGNIRFVANLPDELIILAGIEKIVPDLEKAMKTAIVISRYAGYKVAGYYEIIGGARKILVGKEEIHSKPKRIHLILLDNGRKRMISDPDLREASYCLRCGACMYSCTVFKIIAGKFGGPTYMSGIGAIWTYIINGAVQSAPAIYTCLLDGRCRERCPLKIDIPRMIKVIRTRLTSMRIQNNV